MLVQLQAVQQEVQQMRGALEEQGYKLEGVKNRQRDLYLDIDRRMGNLERSIAEIQDTLSKATVAEQTGTAITPPSAQISPPPSIAVTTPGVTQPSPAATVEAVDPLQEQTTYQQAFTLLKEGRYEQAITGFKNYLEQYPQGRYADNAQYWLGEAYYVTRQFDLARLEFSKVEANKQNRKRPDAMLKLGYTYYELKEWDQARTVLEAIVNEYPNSTVERLANKRLLDMKQVDQ
jgi:tol-pal system protein YbgF